MALLRLSVAALLWVGGPLACAPQLRPWVTLGLIALAFLLGVGILTPALAVICALLKGVGLVCAGDVQTVTTIAALSTAAALALLGPGAYPSMRGCSAGESS